MAKYNFVNKSQRVLAAGVKELDTKHVTLSKELASEFGKALKQLQDKTCSKDVFPTCPLSFIPFSLRCPFQDATHMLHEIGRKANEESLAFLREELKKV